MGGDNVLHYNLHPSEVLLTMEVCFGQRLNYDFQFKTKRVNETEFLLQLFRKI